MSDKTILGLDFEDKVTIIINKRNVKKDWRQKSSVKILKYWTNTILKDNMMGRGIRVIKRNPTNRKAFALLFPTYFSIISNVYGNISVSGYVHKSFDDFSSNNAQVTVIRKPLKEGIDTLFTSVDSYDYWSIYGGNYEPELVGGDTLEVYITKKEGSKNYTSKTKRPIENTGNSIGLLELHLDNPDISIKAFTPGVDRVIDTSNISLPLNGTVKLDKNISQEVEGVIDTNLYAWYQISDAYFNLELQDSIFFHGDSFTVRLEKRLVNQPTSDKDIVYFTEVKSAIDTTFWDAMKVNADNSIHNGAFHGDTLYFPMFVETIDNGTALNQLSLNYFIKGDTVIMNYENDNAAGYKISRRDNNQGDFNLIASTEKSQYKDVVPNGIYDYNLQAIGNDGKVLNEQKFKVKKSRGIENNIKKLLYYGQRINEDSLKNYEVYDLSGKKVNFTKKSPFGLYFIKEYDR